MIALDLGAGKVSPPGYIPIGYGHPQTEIFNLPYDDESIDVIRASHVLEHVARDSVLPTLMQWTRKLKRGGLLMIAVPDYTYITWLYLRLPEESALGGIERFLMGGQDDEHDFHRSVFNVGRLRQLLQACGLVNIEKWNSTIDDCAALPVSLNLMGTRRKRAPLPAGAEPLKARVNFGRDIEDFPESVTRSDLPAGLGTVDVFEK